MASAISSVTTAGAQQANAAWRKDGQQSRAFAAFQALHRAVKAHDPNLQKQAAVQLASTLFFQPLLAEMRKSDAGKNFAHGGRGEDVFGEQLDLRVADSVAASNPGGIVARIARKLERVQTDASTDVQN